MATSNRKPVLRWITLTIMLAAFCGLAATAKAEKPSGVVKLVAKVKEIHVPQMLATVGVNNGSCMEGPSFDVDRGGLISGSSLAKQISKQLKIAGATHWTMIDYVNGSFGSISAVRVIPLI